MGHDSMDMVLEAGDQELCQVRCLRCLVCVMLVREEEQLGYEFVLLDHCVLLICRGR